MYLNLSVIWAEAQISLRCIGPKAARRIGSSISVSDTLLLHFRIFIRWNIQIRLPVLLSLCENTPGNAMIQMMRPKPCLAFLLTFTNVSYLQYLSIYPQGYFLCILFHIFVKLIYWFQPYQKVFDMTYLTFSLIFASPYKFVINYFSYLQQII